MEKTDYQLLISTLNGDSVDICHKCNISSDAIIVNQTDKNTYQVNSFDEFTVEEYGFSQRGIGLSREMAFNLSSAEIIQFSDEDVVYFENYREVVLKEMEKHPEADAILFQYQIFGGVRGDEKKKAKIFKKYHRLSLREATYIGLICGAIRSEKLRYHNIHFNTMFGTKGQYDCGEDTIFLCDMVRSGMRVFVSPITIASTSVEKSSWFIGRTDRYYFNKGSVMAAEFPYCCWVMAFVKALKNQKSLSFKSVLKNYFAGISEYKSHLRQVNKGKN